MSLPQEPYTRIERYLAKFAGQDVDIPDTPITRIECYLAYLCENGGGGGGGGYVPAPNAGAHNAIFRGQSLGDEFTSAQSAAIKGGTFEDLYIGDYWTINDTVYRISGFDTFYLFGDAAMEYHHAVIMPDQPMNTSALMNDTSTTAGGYEGCQLRANVLPAILSTIEADFGATHVLARKTRLVNAITDGVPSGSTWVSSKVELPTESMMIGRGSFGTQSGNGYNVGERSVQLPLFMLEPQYIHNGSRFWLQDVMNATSFAYITNTGMPFFAQANNSGRIGVRPFFIVGDPA